LSSAEARCQRQHARLYLADDSSWWVEDLTRPTARSVNETRIKLQQLADSDQVRFGDAIYKFLSGSNIESAYHEAITTWPSRMA